MKREIKKNGGVLAVDGRSFRPRYSVLALLHLYNLLHLGWINYISDSEFWSINLAAHYTQECLHSWVLSRFLFYFPLGVVLAFAHDSLTVIESAKILGLLNGLLLLAMTFRLAKTVGSTFRATGPLISSWVAVFLLLSKTSFLNQGFRIRSDLLAGTLVVYFLKKDHTHFSKTNGGR